MPFEVMELRTPVLFLVFNRPEITGRVFAALREVRPRRLYVAADGPRPDRPGEEALCRETRLVTEKIDWPCEVRRLYRDANLGCGRGVSDAITWFFDQEPEGIILEDDCLPAPSFWRFCETMLERYREDERIGSVSGDFFFPPAFEHRDPYIFSKYLQIWGWGSWRRVWQHYDFALGGPEDAWKQVIVARNPLDLEARYWWEILRYMRRGLIDTWDYQLMFATWKLGQLHIAPTRYLVTNLGYGAAPTHTIFESPLSALPRTEIATALHELPVNLDPSLELRTFFYRFLDTLHNTWILHQAIDVTEKL